jgi:crotonobetainyl-CoA:carnitine CoA-transferase CaiB-like acyl-CoA transferase
MNDDFAKIAARVWHEAAGPEGHLDALAFSGARQVLPSWFDVTGLAAGSVAAATLAAAEFHAARTGTSIRGVRVDSRAACAAFAAEGLFTPVGWELPPVWDPIAGNYQAQDGWIRLHTNYAYHRAAVERVLGAGDKDSVAAAAADWKAADLEAAVVAAGGCAAMMHSREGWLASPPGADTAAASTLSAVSRTVAAQQGAAGQGTAGRDPAGQAATRPYAGIRVLDLTRVIAGPVATKFLAAYGADVLRVDPPGFEEVAALLPETTAGKRTTALDLTRPAGRAAFEGLVATADVLVTGLRADALDRLGYGDDALAALNPALVIASLDAYGWDGPWRDRRGFDSLVQMSCGIAAAGGSAPVALPVQALDHATGYLIAAAVGRALTRRLAESVVTRIRACLIGTANFLWSLPRPRELPPRPSPASFPLVDTVTAWGPARRVPVPGEITGVRAEWRIEAGPLGRHAPEWLNGLA